MADDELIVTEEQIHAIAEKSTPVKLIESTLASFLNNTFQMAIDEDDYQKDLKNEVRKRLPDFKNTELIALTTSAATNKNDLISKLVAPTMQLLTAAQQNELAQKQRELSPQYMQTNIREVNTTASTDVLVGLNTLMNLLHKLQVKEQIQVTESESTSI